MRTRGRAMAEPSPRVAAIRVGAVAVLAGLVFWFFGAAPWYALVIAAAVEAIGVVWVSWPTAVPDRWRGETWHRHEGARWEVAQLSWSLHARRGGRVGRDVVPRLRELARVRLATRGLRFDVDDPSSAVDVAPASDTADVDAVGRLLGGRALRVLAAPPARPPTLRAVVACLDALDALDGRAPSYWGGRRRREALPRLSALLRSLTRAIQGMGRTSRVR